MDDAHVTFENGTADRAPFVFDFVRLHLSGVSRHRPFHFDEIVDNGAPIGLAKTSGTLGTIVATGTCTDAKFVLDEPHFDVKLRGGLKKALPAAKH